MNATHLKQALIALLALGTVSQAVLAEIETDAPDAEEKTGEDSGAQHDSPPPPDILEFKNKDTLHGFMMSYSPDKGLALRSPEAESEIVFKPDNLKSLIFGRTPRLLENADVSVALTNGDELAGKLVDLNAKTLVLDTDYAGTLSIPRPMVATITPRGNSGALCAGVGKKADWKVMRNNDGASFDVVGRILKMSGYTMVARKIDFPDKCRIDFKMDIRGNRQLTVCAYMDDRGGCGVFLNIMPSRVYLRVRSKNSSWGSSSSIKPLNANPLRITVLLDKQAGAFTLIINDKTVETWSHQFAINGKFFGFATQGGSEAKISDLKIRKWDGTLPAKKKKTAEETAKATFVFINGDKVSGVLKSIKNGVAALATEYAEMKVPMKRVAMILMPRKGARTARRNTGDAKFIFEDGSALTLDVERIADGVARGKSENFGKADFKLDVFSKIEFNIYDDEE